MIIDAHQHFWIFDPVRDSWITPEMEVIRRDFLPANLAPILAENSVDGCVAVQADQSDSETIFLLKQAESNEFVKGVVGWVDLQMPVLYDKLEEYSLYEKMKGFRHVAQGQPEGFLLQPAFVGGVAQLAAFDFSYDILVYANQLQEAFQFAKALPNVRFVLDHIAKPFIKKGEIEPWAADIRKLAELPNVLCKVSGMVTEADWKGWKLADFKPYMDVAFDAFGVQRIMFGSDWPVCLVSSDYGQMKSIVTDYLSDFSQGEKDLVMGGNATTFYRLE
jgi:L-fuconolactonase